MKSPYVGSLRERGIRRLNRPQRPDVRIKQAPLIKVHSSPRGDELCGAPQDGVTSKASRDAYETLSVHDLAKQDSEFSLMNSHRGETRVHTGTGSEFSFQDRSVLRAQKQGNREHSKGRQIGLPLEELV